MLEIRLCGGLLLRVNGEPVPDALLAGRQGRLVFAYLACERHRAVPREELADLLWPSTMPSSWTTSLSAVISRLRKMLNEVGLDGVDTLASPPGAYQLVLPDDATIDWDEALRGIVDAEVAVEAGDTARALELAASVAAVAERGFLSDDCPWVDRQRDSARDVQVRALLARGTAYLQSSAPARAVEVARDALALDPAREASFRLLMRALARAGERAEALRVWERCRATLVDELGVDPSPETEAVYLDVLGAASFAEPPSASPATTTALPSGVITFLLTDIVESSALWEREPQAMAVALERHDALVAETVRKCGGALLKSKLEGDATVSVFTRATSGMNAALLLRDAFRDEPWPAGAFPRVRMALHTGEAYERDGDYFGPALNRAARLRSLATADQILLSQAVAELVRDHVPDDAVLLDRGHRDLRGLSRGENVYELAARGLLEEMAEPGAFVIPELPSALSPAGPFVGRDQELQELSSEWELSLAGSARAVLVGGEPGVGKSRLVAEAARLARENGALVLYGRCDEELGVPYQPFVEAVRLAAPTLGSRRLREVRGVDNLVRMVPELVELVPDAASATRADPETERYALFGAVTQLLVSASSEAPVLLVLDDLHWAGKTTLALLRHVLRDADNARLLVLATYRDTELSRTHPLASTIADLRGDGVARRVTLSGLPVNDVVAYLAAVGHDDRALGRELAKVTSGNPFFLIEALRHVEETGGSWKPGSLPEGVKEATGRRLSRLSDAASAALSTAAVVGSTFSLDVVETLQQTDLVEQMDEACRAGLIIEEADTPGTFRFAHALVRQVLLAELVTVKRVRMHRAVAELLESRVSERDAFLTDLAYHWFECASSGAADKAVAACMRAAEHAIERLAYEEAADLFGMAIEAAEATDVDADTVANLHLERCDALLTAGEVGLARGALEGLRRVARSSPRLTAWHTTFAGQLAVFAEPDRLVEVVDGVGEAAQTMRDVQDVAGEAKARYVYALALERLGRIGDAEKALDAALAAARTADDRHLADAILAEVPLAVLWGPSPVTRASGRCLDVVRVCRITAGAAAVESVALRCQAVLEALRGRTDAARRMIGSARRTAEQLGLAHHRLETDVSAGLIELLAAEWANAETLLQSAYDELRDRGLDGEAARAGGLLGRALLMQRRTEEAEIIALEAEQLAGADVRANITYRGVLAEAAAHRGDTERALELARAAVDMCAATDALLPLADARLSLANVLAITGDHSAADAEAHRAEDVCNAKGATVLAEAARAASRGGATRVSVAPSPAATGVREAAYSNEAARIATRLFTNVVDASNFEMIPDAFVLEDHRSLPRLEMDLRMTAETVEFIKAGGFSFGLEIVATRGQTLLLSELTLASATERFDILIASRVANGQVVWSALYDDDDLDAAVAALDREYVATEGAAYAEILTAFTTFVQSINHDPWELTRPQLADDFFFRDFKSATGVPIGPDELSTMWADFPRRGRGGRETRIAHILDVAPNALIAVLEVTGHTSTDGGPFEEHTIEVMAFEDGLIQSFDAYNERDIAEARARFDQLTELHRPTSSAVAVEERWANATVRVIQAFSEALNSNDREGTIAPFEPTYFVHDRRRMVAGEIPIHILGREVEALMRETASVTFDVLATRGERLALVRGAFDIDGSETVIVALMQTNEHNRFVKSIWFDEDALDDAYAALDEVCAGIDPASLPDGVWVDLNERRLESALARVTAEYVARDHRSSALMEADAVDEVGATLLAYDRLSPDIRLLVHHTRKDAKGQLTALTAAGTVDGGPFEIEVILVHERDQRGIFVAQDTFGPDQAEQAWALFDELTTEKPDPMARFDNAATKFGHDLVEAIARGEGSAGISLFTTDVVFEDQRPFSIEASERDELLGLYDAYARDGGWLSMDVLATRGQNLAVTDARWHNDGATLHMLAVVRTNDEGKCEHLTVFHEDQLDAAYETLERLDAESRTGLGVDAFNRRDWDAFASRFSPNVVQQDHRPARLGTIRGRARVVDSQRVLVDLAPDTKLRTHHEQRVGNYALAVSSMLGTQEHEPFETNLVTVQILDTAGSITHRHVFDITQAEAALALFDELTAPAPLPPGRFENTAHRTTHRIIEGLRSGDVHAIEACVSPTFSVDDRRAIIRGEFDPFDSGTITALIDLGVDTQPLTEATRGDHLYLIQAQFHSDDADWHMSIAIEAGDDGLITHMTWLDDLDEAYAVLDERYLASNPTPLFVRREAHDATILGGDWNALGAFYAEDASLEDHRDGRYGIREGRDVLVGLARSLADAASGLRFRNHHFAESGDVALISTSRIGRTDAGAFEHKIWSVIQHNDAGEITHWDIYDHEQQDEAWNRYDDLVAPVTPEPFANAVVGVIDRVVDAFNAGDWARLGEMADGRLVADNRAFAQLGAINGVQTLQIVAEAGDATLERRRIFATRGDRLCLIEVRALVRQRDAGVSEVPVLGVVGIDEQGSVEQALLFDPEEHDKAFDELDRLYAATFDEQTRLVAAGFMEAATAFDVDALMRFMADDLEIEDHRAHGFGRIRRDLFVNAGNDIKRIAIDGRLRFDHVLDMTPDGALVVLSITGDHETGGFELRAVIAAGFQDGVATEVHVYDVDQLDEARHRFDELVTATTPEPWANAAVRLGDAVMAAWNAGDWDAVAETFGGTAATFDDNRSYAQLGTTSLFDTLQVPWEASERTWMTRYGIVATREDSFAITDVSVSVVGGDSGPSEVPGFAMSQVDEAGSYVYAAVFDDVAAAFAELDRRYLESLDTAEATTFTSFVAIADAMANPNDLAALCSDDFVAWDHRGFGTQGELKFGEWLAQIEQVRNSASELRYRVDHVIGLTTDAAAGLVTLVGTIADMPVELPTIGFIRIDDKGLVRELHGFEPHMLDEVRARFNAT